jgi:ABC-2 type transport system permease protein
VVWDSYNPHPDLAHLPSEIVFVGAGNENPEAFNQGDTSTSALQELVFLYPGHLAAAAGSDIEFTPLLRTGEVSSSFPFYQMVQRSFFGVQLNRNLRHTPEAGDFVLAAHVKGAGGNDASETEAEGEADEADDSAEDAARPLNVIVVADLDFISEQFFEIRRIGPENLTFDNVTFFLNAIDVLLGDESFVALRSRRMKHRTLERVEGRTRSFIERRAEEEKAAEDGAEKALDDAQERLEKRVAEVSQRADLDTQTKQIMARNLQEVENRRLEVLKANIEVEKEAKVQASKERMESQIRQIQSNIRALAVLLPPIPVFVIGVMIFVRRRRRERLGAAAARRLRSGS